uniref:Porin OmpF n=1 Tax=Candidatus Aschnera chinzeii TaxID=1485666 RepID=A0AAT9G512_9ENTR|nr:MAG: porin OmpF [Candidatus Aschnera chinzeii]
MKYNILAIIIPVFLAGTTHAAEIYNMDGIKLNLYGKVNAGHIFTKNDVNNGYYSNAVIGIKGNSKISDHTMGYGNIELETSYNKNINNIGYNNKLIYAGLKFSDFNSLEYGRNYGILYDINSWTGVLPIYGSEFSSNNHNYMSSINRNLLTYRCNNFFGLIDGFNFAIQYQGKHNDINKLVLDGVNDNKLSAVNIDKGYGVTVNYNIGWGLTLGGGYGTSNLNINNIIENKNNNLTENKKAESWNAGIKYDNNNLYLAAIYGENNNMTKYNNGIDENHIAISKIAHKIENIELVAQYLFDGFGLKPSIAYVQSKGKNLSNSKHNNLKENLIKYSSLGAFYYFNKNLTAIIDYKINLISDNQFTKLSNIDRGNVLGLGVIYKF